MFSRGVFVDLLTQTVSAAAGNLLQPAVLFFALGLIAALARSDLALPSEAAKTLSLILML
ncbi:MAG: sodium-dependent bicarbonate transport family permease, partial [Caulobacter sp.]